MNVVQLHERVRFWVDIVGSTRFESQDIDNALNVAIANKVRESYDQNRPMNRSDAFQRIQRVRDELGPLVKKAVDGDGLTVTDNFASITASDYGWLLAMRIMPDQESVWYEARPLTYNRKNILQKNPFRRIRKVPSRNVYYNELDGDFEITIYEGNIINDIEIYYLATPAIINYGLEYDDTKSFTNGDVVYVVRENTLYAGTYYKIGDTITIATPNLSIDEGLVVFDYVNCDVRSTAHEEISRRAAINLLLTANEYEKAKSLREEIMAS